MDLQEYLTSIIPLSKAKADLIASYFEEEFFPKNTFLIQDGYVSRKSYFVESGIIRSYLYNREGEEITTRFYAAPDFLNDYLSFFKQQPSEEYYQTLTDCKTWTISLENVQHCFHNIPEFREWGRMLLTLNYVTMHNRMISFHKYDATERYVHLVEQQPEIIEKIPLKYIASYLGVTKHPLSRIRKNIADS